MSLTKEQHKKPLWVRIINGLSEISGYLSGLAILLASLVTMHQVLVRYFIGDSTIWQTELAIYLLLFATFVGSSYGLKKGAHVGVDVLIEKMSPKMKSYMKIVTSLLSLALVIVIAWKGWGMWHHAYINNWTSETIWGPPLAYPYFTLPLGMTLLSLQFIVLIYEETLSLRNKKTNRSDHDKPSKVI